MRARIHRGATQVGGTCVELESSGQRLLLDLGMPLDAEEGEVPLPEIAGLRAEDPSLLGVLVSHLHGDHCGLVPYARPGLPLGMGATAARILREAEFFTGRPALPAPRWSFEDRRPFQVGPFRVTPYQVEHSALDAFALLVEAGGRQLLYSGDLRAHGNDRAPWQRLTGEPPRDVDAFLLEGTQLGDGRAGEGPSEAELGATLADRFRAWPGLVLAAWSSQNLDRLRTVYQAARQANRTLVIDLYTATLARAAGVPGLPALGAEGLEVYCRRRERLQVKEAQAFERVRAVHGVRVSPEELAARAGELVVMVRPSMARELEQAGALRGALAIWSLWGGYLEGPTGRWLRAALDRHGVPLERHHVSGHAYVTDLRRLVDAVRPGYVVPIHTQDPAGYAAAIPGVDVRPDGAWWDV